MPPPLRVLLTGFEPFGDSTVNPSEALVRRLAAHTDALASTLPNLRIRTAVLPVVGGTGRGSAWERLEAALLDEHDVHDTMELRRAHAQRSMDSQAGRAEDRDAQPGNAQARDTEGGRAASSLDAVILFGEAHTRSALSLERVALNLMDYRLPDNAGRQVVDEPVIPRAPTAHLATLPLRAMKAACERAGVPCELSLSAGTFLCNETMFRLLDHAARGGAPRMAGFVHLPQLPEQRALRPTRAEPMALDAMVRGACALLQAVAEVTPAGAVLPEWPLLRQDP